MKVIIRNEPRDVQVTSLILESDPLNPDKFEMWYCGKCREGLFQYSGHIVMVVPGYTHTSIPVVIRCRNCKKRYLINSIM